MDNQSYLFPLIQRRMAKEVNIGGTFLGGQHPIRIQSMTNTSTLDNQKSIEQIEKLFHAGSDYVRMTTQNIKEAENLKEIKKQLRQRNINIPLIADVHFSHKIAEKAAEIVEKVRINPGNFYEKRQIDFSHYSLKNYEEDLEQIAQKVKKLAGICQKNGTAIRIGVNHGSLSERIVFKYGDTIEGMVESALEFVRLFAQENFHELVVSLKSSNPKIMVYANRLLVQKMAAEKMYYPLHLGVTEAGEGEEGRIKSTAGIGTLLLDGIGDTIRVSLTENPEKEIPVARKLAHLYAFSTENPETFASKRPRLITEYQRKPTYQVQNLGSDSVPAVMSVLSKNEKSANADFISKKASDKTINKITIFKNHKGLSKKEANEIQLIILSKNQAIETIKTEVFSKENHLVLALKNIPVNHSKHFIHELKKHKKPPPVLIWHESSESDYEKYSMQATALLSSLLIDGYIDGICIENQHFSTQENEILSFDILQACGSRSYKTDFIACPSCGRTQFNIQERLQEVKNSLSHLKDLKIAVMGCIVNGPGEMADADYGYVGMGKDKVSLYKRKKCIAKNIPTKDALKKLIEIIKENGDWIGTNN